MAFRPNPVERLKGFPPPRERIMVFGSAGTGKSHALGKIADMSQQSGSDAQFYIMDTDAAWERMLYTDFPKLENVEYRMIEEWDDYLTAIDDFQGKMRPEDWLVVDLVSPAWDEVQANYIQRIFGMSQDDFFVEARKQDKKMALDGWKDWSVINRMYRKFAAQLPRTKGHLYLTAMEDLVSSDTDSSEIRQAYGPYGYKPKGQKHTPHLVHTLLRFKLERPGEWSMTTVKDRGREQMRSTEIKNFASDYLLGVAGWRV